MIVLGSYPDIHKGLFTVPTADLLYHTAFIGQSGSGKSFAIARLLEEITLRTRARIVILDPNGDFGNFYAAHSSAFWAQDPFRTQFASTKSRTPAGIPSYDSEVDFTQQWNARNFQFVSTTKRDWQPYRARANAAPLRWHWKWLPRGEQDFLLHVDTMLYPKIQQGVITCFHYVAYHKSEFPQDYSLRDLEDIAEAFALKQVAMADLS